MLEYTKNQVTAIGLIELCRQETKKRKEEETGPKCKENGELKNMLCGHGRYRPIPAETQTDTKGAKKHVVRTWPIPLDTGRNPDRYQEYRPETSRYPDRYSCAEISYEAFSPLLHFKTFPN